LPWPPRDRSQHRFGSTLIVERRRSPVTTRAVDGREQG
jgi:hypothetical protein